MMRKDQYDLCIYSHDGSVVISHWRAIYLMTHMYAIDVEGEVADGDRVLESPELDLQHALKAPAHEGGMGEPGRH